MEIRIGDVVRFKQEYLRKIGETHSRMTLMRGYVKNIRSVGAARMLDIQWDNHGLLPAKIDAVERVQQSH